MVRVVHPRRHAATVAFCHACVASPLGWRSVRPARRLKSSTAESTLGGFASPQPSDPGIRPRCKPTSLRSSRRCHVNRPGHRVRGSVTETLTAAGSDDWGWEYRPSPTPTPIPARRHPPRRLALSALHAQLPRRRGTPGRTRPRCFVRDGPAMGPEVRAAIRSKPACQATAAKRPMVSRRDGRLDRRQPEVVVAGRGQRGRSPRPGCAIETGQEGCSATDMNVVRIVTSIVVSVTAPRD